MENVRSMFKEVAKELIRVNREIDRMSDHKFKSMGSLKSNASALADAWMKYGLSYGQAVETLRDSKNTLEALKKVVIGGTVYVADPSETIVYKRIA